MNISGSLGSASAYASSASSKLNNAASDFMSYMQETPAQQMQDSWLKAHGITSAQYSTMSPAQKESISNQMASDIKTKVQQQTENKTAGTGSMVNMLV